MSAADLARADDEAQALGWPNAAEARKAAELSKANGGVTLTIAFASMEAMNAFVAKCAAEGIEL
jgi:hypothetical protein